MKTNQKYYIVSFIAVVFGLLVFYFIQHQKQYDNIILGTSLPLSGINQDLGNEIIEGANSYFSHINAKGGINDKHIQFLFYDDKYEPQNTLINIQKLLYEDNVFALFGFVGTPTAKKVLPLVIDSKVPFIAPYTGASFLRRPDVSNIINFRASYEQEIEGIVDYLYRKKNITKFSIFYQNDDFGEEGYIALIKALQKRNLTLISEGTYKRNTLSVSHAIHEIKNGNPEAVIVIGAYKPSARFIQKAKECCFENTIFAPISFVNSDALIRELDCEGANIIFSQTVPSFDDESIAVAKEYKKLLNFYYPNAKPSHVSFESFLAAKAVAKALENTGENLTRDNFIYQLTHLNPNVLDGISIDYKNTQLLNKTYLLNFENMRFNILFEGEY
jgi:ABC-type branched-subunit amino acid transport system substrate-binding protein